ncbi:pollen receptor-like kinase 3 [Ricinus communis]|uniref:Serine/threonine-protein kinase PBS1, putative n=1 Tax=Ricinus communis TaxID=3988 RepID=B9RR77_RICCO|nr:pollen receptor-like kinase 3 [Ricinus communis]EEF46248.1 Serine/threonine-protein kinase PBS1, putative [Ricinus communis]|eukprot:XP_002516246.1 pollen receptor-like kinase 3 [Ricinus communis]
MTVVRLLVLLFLLTLSLWCNLSFSLSENESLLKLKKSLNHAGVLDDWVSGSNPCVRRWVGVICFGGIITGLHLSDLGLSGTIDIEALQQLPGLRTISFVNNSFSGPIPEFNKLGALKSLLLTHNEFSGEIANDFFTPMSSLKKVWLSENKFTGKIPDSLMQLSLLKELHLEGNQFSGKIPPLKQSKLNSLDLSQNLLEGEIPQSLSAFSASSFAGNTGLCGKPLATECSSSLPSLPGQPESHPPAGDNTNTMVGVVVLLLITLLISCTLCSSNKSDKDEFSFSEKENLDELVLSVRGNGSSKKPPLENSRKGPGSRRASQHNNGNGMTDLIMVNDEKGSFGLPDLMKAAAEVLGSGGLGSAYKAMMTSGLSVVVKRMREMNVLGRDSFDAEMRRFGRIRHKNILTPLAYHFRKEEKLLVSEYIPKGSLLYVLHGDRGMCHAELNWPIRLKIIKGIANGLGFLHSDYSTYNLPHGNLKSSNVLLDENYEPLLGDYALDPLTNSNHSAQAMFAYKSPEYITTHQVSPKSDVYCFGIIILEIITGKFPSQYLSNGKGGTDVVQWVLQASSEGREQELIDPEIANTSNTNSIHQMVQMLRIGAACAETDATQRLDMSEAIRRIEEIKV